MQKRVYICGGGELIAFDQAALDQLKEIFGDHIMKIEDVKSKELNRTMEQ